MVTRKLTLARHFSRAAREYFYFLDKNGRLFLEETKLRNYTVRLNGVNVYFSCLICRRQQFAVFLLWEFFQNYLFFDSCLYFTVYLCTDMSQRRKIFRFFLCPHANSSEYDWSSCRVPLCLDLWCGIKLFSRLGASVGYPNPTHFYRTRNYHQIHTHLHAVTHTSSPLTFICWHAHH